MNSKSAPLEIRQILVPVDFSECSEAAVDYALALAPRFKASLVLLHVMEPFHAGSLAEGRVEQRWYAQQLRSAKESLARRAAAKATSRVPIRHHVKEGSPALTITEWAQRMKIDLIVIATHGRTGMKHFLMGSVAERVVRHARCPVLTVRSGG